MSINTSEISFPGESVTASENWGTVSLTIQENTKEKKASEGSR